MSNMSLLRNRYLTQNTDTSFLNARVFDVCEDGWKKYTLPSISSYSYYLWFLNN